MPAWLLIAAESREFAGILKRTSDVQHVELPGVAFACEIRRPLATWRLLANGPGKLCAEALQKIPRPGALMSVGFAGALDPVLRIGDIVIAGDFPETECPGLFQGEILRGRIVRGKILTLDRV